MAKEKAGWVIYKRACTKPASLRFRELANLAESAGFRLDRIHGSHHIFIHPKYKVLINLQNVKGQAKPYQVRQLLKLIKELRLLAPLWSQGFKESITKEFKD
jgi:predicted RNA binding protein YcfA (HicA-like mRNA interferase family)